MGEIQNSINQMLGTVGTVATLGKHLKQQEEAATIRDAQNLEKASETYVESGQNVDKLTNEMKDIKKELKEIKNDPLMSQAQEIQAAHDPSKNYSYGELIKDKEGNLYEPNQYLERGKKRMTELAEKKKANEYAQNLMYAKMKAQDKMWEAQGIDIEKDLYGAGLNSRKEHEQIMDWKDKMEKKIGGKK